MSEFWPDEEDRQEIIVRNGRRYQVLREPSEILWCENSVGALSFGVRTIGVYEIYLTRTCIAWGEQ